MNDIQAVILAAGEGTRFRPLTKNRPQVLLPVANKPILERVLDSVVACGIRDITVVVGYQKEQVMKLLNSYPVTVNVVIQPKQIGTANALAAAKKMIHTNTLILPGDNFIGEESIRLLLSAKDNAILGAPHENPEKFGVISQKNGMLTGIVEKPDYADETQAINCSVYYFTKELIDSVDMTNIREMPQLLTKYIENGEQIRVVMTTGWLDAVCPADLLGANEYYLKKMPASIAGKIDAGARISGHVSLGKDTVVCAGAVITGPAVIGENCVIGPNVCIGPETSIGSRVRIEPFCYIKNSIIMNDCSIDSGSRIVQAFLGEGCRLSNSIATIGDVVSGDQADIGPLSILKNCSVGNNAVIEGGKTVTGVIPDDARVI